MIEAGVALIVFGLWFCYIGLSVDHQRNKAIRHELDHVLATFNAGEMGYVKGAAELWREGYYYGGFKR